MKFQFQFQFQFIGHNLYTCIKQHGIQIKCTIPVESTNNYNVHNLAQFL
jgi:hypothetical protein